MKRIHAFSGYAVRMTLLLLALAISECAMAGSEGHNAFQYWGENQAALHADSFGAKVGQIALQYVGINVVTNVTSPGAGQAVTVGYYTYIAGIQQSLFSDQSDQCTMNVACAYFTFRSEPYSFATFANENILVRTVSPGFLIKLYYNQTPDQTFDNLDTFSDGQLIATFKVETSQATRVENEAHQQASLTLVSAQPFWFQGRYYTIRKIVRHGVTLFSAGSAVPVDDSYTAFAYAGSALAD